MIKKAINQDVVMGAALLLISGVLYMMARELISEAAIFPMVLIILLAIFALAILFKGVGRDEKTYGDHGDDEEELNVEMLKSPLIVFAGIFLYCLLITVVGFFVATSIFLVLYLYLNRYRSIIKVITTVLVVNLFIYLLFVQQLNVRLPAGLMFE